MAEMIRMDELRSPEERWRPGAWHFVLAVAGGVAALFGGLSLLVIVATGRQSIAASVSKALAMAVESSLVHQGLFAAFVAFLVVFVIDMSQRRIQRSNVAILDADTRSDAAVAIASITMGQAAPRGPGRVAGAPDMLELQARQAAAEESAARARWLDRRDQPEPAPRFDELYLPAPARSDIFIEPGAAPRRLPAPRHGAPSRGAR